MAIFKEPIQLIDTFVRAATYGTTPGHNGWTFAADGTATAVPATNGGVVIANAAGGDNGCLYQNDVLIFDVDEVQTVKFLVKVASLSATTRLVLGVASARNDDPDVIAASAWFSLEGSSGNILVESDDGVTDRNDVATGQVLSTTIRRLSIDFTQNGGKRNLAFKIDDQWVVQSTTFTFDGYSGGLQPIIQLQESGAGTPSVTVEKVEWITSRVYS